MAQQPDPRFVPDDRFVPDERFVPEETTESKDLGLRDYAAMGIRGLSAFVPGGPLGAAAGAIGEGLAQTIEPRESYNFPQMGVQAGLGAIPFGRVASIGRGLLKGAALGATGTTATKLAETGELPSGTELGLGAGLGAAGGGLASKLPIKRGNITKVADSVVTKPETALAKVQPELPISQDATQKLIQALEEAKPINKIQAGIYTQERAEKITRAKGTDISGEEGARKYMSQLAGEHTKIQVEPLKLEQPDVDALYTKIGQFEFPDEFERPRAITGLKKILEGQIPQDNELRTLGKVFGPDIGSNYERILPLIDKRQRLVSEAINFPRAIQASWDMSAPMRQGLPLINRKEWWTSLDDMVKSYGSENAYKGVMDSIKTHPLFEFGQESGLKLTDLVSRREEAIMSTWAEKVPLVRRSNRAYTAFLNKTRQDVFSSLIKDAEVMGLNPKQNQVLARQIAEYVNNASGRGDLGRFEKSAEILNNVFFSPRLIASRVNLLNPKTYVMAPSFVRKQYLKSMRATAGAWMTISGLASMAGADVTLDPNSSDFGKIKIGNTRLDPGAGFQQFLVLFSRMRPTALGGGFTSSTTGEQREFGEGFGQDTRFDVATDFLFNKLHPVLNYFLSPFRATEYRPFDVTDRTVRMFTPIIMQDLSELIQEDPTLLPLLAPSAIGMGTQVYGERGESSKVIPQLPSMEIY